MSDEPACSPSRSFPRLDEPRPPVVQFRVVCHGLDPARVTALTGITPSYISDGGPFGGQIRRGIRLPTGSWTLTMPPAAEQPIDDQLAALLDRLEPHTAALRALPDCRLFVLLDLYINWMFSERTDHVSAETLGRIASLGATLSLDTTYETETHDG